MLAHLATYAATLVAMVVLDSAWLTVMVPRLYRPAMGDMLAPAPSFPAAAVFYLVYPIGLLVFAIQPAFRATDPVVLWRAAAFGFFTYATYDLTNQATLRNWSWQLTLADVAWGAILALLAAAVGYWVATKIG